MHLTLFPKVVQQQNVGEVGKSITVMLQINISTYITIYFRQDAHLTVDLLNRSTTDITESSLAPHTIISNGTRLTRLVSAITIFC